MATKDSKGNLNTKAKATTPRYNDVVFISFPLSEQQKADIKNAVWDIEDFDNCLIHLAESNYKITTSYDDYSSAYACFITPKGDKHRNAGFILTGRGSTPHKAVKQAYFVHTELFNGDWSSWKAEGRGEILDD